MRKLCDWRIPRRRPQRSKIEREPATQPSADCSSTVGDWPAPSGPANSPQVNWRPCVESFHYRLGAEFRLTGRERETVDLLARGLTNKEIALAMGLSCNTVKAFLRSLMAKLRITTRAGIVGSLVTHMG